MTIWDRFTWYELTANGHHANIQWPKVCSDFLRASRTVEILHAARLSLSGCASAETAIRRALHHCCQVFCFYKHLAILLNLCKSLYSNPSNLRHIPPHAYRLLGRQFQPRSPELIATCLPPFCDRRLDHKPYIIHTGSTTHSIFQLPDRFSQSYTLSPFSHFDHQMLTKQRVIWCPCQIAYCIHLHL